ncbi:MAG: DUF4405 domain-containing protein [Candidatus Onthomorpha sp.]
MKKFLSLALIMASMFLISQTAQAQCPFGGKVNCKGECGRFTDDNADGYCDFAILEQSEPAPKAEEVSSNEQQTSSKKGRVNIKERKLGKEKSPEKPQITDLPEQMPTEQTPTLTQEPQSETSTETTAHQASTKTQKPYRVITISVLCLALYLLTFVLEKSGKIKKTTHRKIWNSILLITCLVSCILGFVLALQINYHFAMGIMKDILKLHVEFGIAMTIVALFHIFWHLKYYKNLFKK